MMASMEEEGGVPYTGYNNFQHGGLTAEVNRRIDEEKMRWLVQEFPNIDETILEDILFNAAHGDINGALDLLEELEKDYEVPLPEAPAINEENFPSLGGDGGGKAGDNNNIHKNNIATKKEEEELPRKMYLSGEDRATSRGKLLPTSLSTTSSSLIQPSLAVRSAGVLIHRRKTEQQQQNLNGCKQVKVYRICMKKIGQKREI